MGGELLGLAERAERATGADGDEFRIISEAALAIFGWQDERHKSVLRLLEAGAFRDAARALINESDFDEVATGRGTQRAFAQLVHPRRLTYRYGGLSRRPPSIYVRAGTEALALCAAALRAKALALTTHPA